MSEPAACCSAQNMACACMQGARIPPMNMNKNSLGDWPDALCCASVPAAQGSTQQWTLHQRLGSR